MARHTHTRWPGGGRGFVRPASLTSLWSTAPFLQNNSVGEFNDDPSVEGRLKSFDNSIRQMLWPERRRTDDKLKSMIPGPSYIQRTTAVSYISRCRTATCRANLLGWSEWLQNWLEDLLPWAFNPYGDLQIGPIPKGTPVNRSPTSSSWRRARERRTRTRTSRS